MSNDSSVDPEPAGPGVRRTVRWRGALAAAVALAVAGVAGRSAPLLLAAVVPLAYLAYGSLSSVDVPDGLVAERTIDPATAPPGRPVRVTLRVTNESDRPLSDVRVVDPVPDDLAVTAGTPRAGTTLDAGETCEIEYAVVARRGEFDFPPPRVRVRGAGAGAVATLDLAPAGDERLVCRLDADAPPLSSEGDGYVGRRTADESGDGVAFHSTREYRTGDPADRIDWRGYAKRGELATVNYERRVSTTVVLVIDAREPSHVVAGPGRPTAVEFEAYAATRAITSLLREGHEAAVAVVGLDGPGPAGLHWLPPGGGREQRSRALDLFRVAAEAAEERRVGPDAAAEQFRRLTDLTSSDDQFALFTPALDDQPVEAVEAWRAFGRSVVAVSPDVVSENTVSGQFAAVRRRARLAACRDAGARPIDWRRGTPLALVLTEAFDVEARGDLRATPNGGGR